MVFLLHRIANSYTKVLLKLALDVNLDAARVLRLGNTVDPAQGRVAVGSVVLLARVPAVERLGFASLDGVLGVVNVGENGHPLLVVKSDVLRVVTGEEHGLGDVGRRVCGQNHALGDGYV